MRGHATVLVLLGMSVISILVVGAVRWQRGEAARAEDAWAMAAARSLADGGIEASRGSRAAGRPIAPEPLGAAIDLGGANGRLSVQAQGATVTACGVVERRGHAPARACVVATLGASGQVLSWRTGE